MAEFKKLSAVEAVKVVSDTATVLIEEDGVIKRASKSDVTDFQKLNSVEVVEEPSEVTNVFIEENGVIKKSPKTAVGGVSGYVIKPTIDEVTVDVSSQTFTCTTNRDELLKTLEAGGAGWTRVPMGVLNPTMAETIPYFYAQVLSWGMYEPVELLSTETSSPYLMCHGSMFFDGNVMDGLFVFTNGTYVPDISLDYEIPSQDA